MGSEQTLNQWGQIVAKAWQDDAFRKRLVANPAAVFKELGLDVAPGVEIRVLENTGTILNLTLPAKPLEGGLSEAELEGVAGGGFMDSLFAGVSTVSKSIPRVVEEQAYGALAKQLFGPKEPGLLTQIVGAPRPQ